MLMKLLHKHFVLFIQEIKDIILNFMESPRLRVGDPPKSKHLQNKWKKNKDGSTPTPKHRIKQLEK